VLPIDPFAILAAMGQAETATVEAFLYQDGQGVEHYDTPTVVTCVSDSRRRLVPDTGTGTGAQALSSSTVYLPVGTVCPLHSRVTLVDGAGPREVMQVLDNSSVGLPTPDHLEVLLT
jgi:hypothetical protein